MKRPPILPVIIGTGFGAGFWPWGPGTAGAVLATAIWFAMSAVMGQYQETMQRLGSRLNEPFVTVATVSGDKGIKQAQDEYQRLQNNSLPKSKRK